MSVNKTKKANRAFRVIVEGRINLFGEGEEERGYHIEHKIDGGRIVSSSDSEAGIFCNRCFKSFLWDELPVALFTEKKLEVKQKYLSGRPLDELEEAEGDEMSALHQFIHDSVGDPDLTDEAHEEALKASTELIQVDADLARLRAALDEARKVILAAEIIIEFLEKRVRYTLGISQWVKDKSAWLEANPNPTTP